VVTDDRIGRSTLVDEVVGRLRELISSGQIAPGERLRMRDLQDRFGVSHIPIREALRTLEGERLVENLPQRGAVASPVSLELLDEVYDARRLLEPAVAVRGMSRMTDDDLAELAAAFAALEVAEILGDDDFYRAHRRFHWLSLRAGATPTLERLITQLWGISDRFVKLSKSAYPADVRVASAQHTEIFRMCAARDEAVGPIIDRHLHVTQDVLRARFAEHVAAEAAQG